MYFMTSNVLLGNTKQEIKIPEDLIFYMLVVNVRLLGD